jgi:hypothetical protein
LKHILALILAATCCGGLSAQVFTGDSLYYLRPADTMTVYNDVASGQILFDHYVAPGQTLYGVATFYGLSLEDVYHLNPQLRSKYESGDKARMAIPRQVIRAKAAKDSLAWFVPVYYRMGKGETLFGLYKRILQLPDDTQIKSLNPKLDPTRMSTNQVLAIGYMKLDGIPKAMQGEIEDVYVRRNRGLRDLWNIRTDDKKMITEKGKAAWTQKGDPNKWMVLHRTAPINSLIEIEDPRSRKTIYARVVARISDQVTDPNVIVVVSPLLVKAFGVRDKHFYVRTRHF